MTEYNFDVQSMVDEIPKKFNRSNHRPKDGNGIPLEWLDLQPTTKNPQIPNNLLTSIKQAIETPEWKSLGLFYTKRGKVSEFNSKFIDIVAVLLQYIPLLSHSQSTNFLNQYISTSSCSQNDIDPNKIIEYLYLYPINSNKSTFHIPYSINYTINQLSNTLLNQYISTSSCSQNDMDFEEDEELFDGYKALGISSILNDDYKIDKPFADKVVTALITPYTINGKQHQILYRKPNPEFTETSKKSRWLYGFDSFFRTKKIPYTFKYTNIENHYVRKQHQKILEMGNWKLLTIEYRNFLKLQLPTRSFFIKHLDSLIGSELKYCTVTNETITPRKRKNKNKYYHVDNYDGYIYIEDSLSNSDHYIYNIVKPQYVKFGHDYYRHYSPYNMSNCILRSLITYNGYGLDQCDVSSMYPVILLQEYDKRFRDTNDTIEHERILEVITATNPRDVLMRWCQELGIKIDKSEMKTENLTYYNMRASQAQAKYTTGYRKGKYKMKIHEMYMKMLPKFAEWLIHLKVHTQAGHKGYWQHKFVSRWLEWKESTIMDRVLMQCEDAGILFQGIHDGIDVEHGKGDQVAQWIKQSMLDNGYICNVTVTYGEKQ